MADLADINEIRLRNYKSLLVQQRQLDVKEGLPERGYLTRFAERANISARYMSHVNNGRKNIGDDTARKIEDALGLGHGWMDHDHATGPSSNANEREFVALALQLFQVCPEEAQAALMRLAIEKLKPRSKK